MLKKWVWLYLMPHMVLKSPNTRYSVYTLKHIAEREIGRYVSQEELQGVLSDLGFPVSEYYPVSNKFFREVECREYEKTARNRARW